MDSNEREALDELLRSDGWRYFLAHANGEWGPGGREFVDGVTKAADNTNNQQATDHLRQIIVAQKRILRLLSWPEERLKSLKPLELVASDGLAAQSRRGGL